MAGLREKLQRMWNPPDDEYDYDENYYEEEEEEDVPAGNYEETEKDVARRIVDFLSGVAYANNGKIQKVATRTFIVTPYDVEISGDEVLDELESSGLYF